MKVLFVCMGNICRSPTAEAVFRKLLREQPALSHVEADSAGTHAYHVNEPPDPRTIAAARRRGIDMDDLRARAVTVNDFRIFDLVLAMDESNLEILMRICPAEYQHKVRLFLEGVDAPAGLEMPDPYYGGEAGFELALDLAEQGSAFLIAEFLKDE